MPPNSTCQGREYLHMDCLFLRADSRGSGLGALLMEAVVAEARALGLDEVQWQTPTWNESAVRFYDRLGAHAKEKLRYGLMVTGGRAEAHAKPQVNPPLRISKT